MAVKAYNTITLISIDDAVWEIIDGYWYKNGNNQGIKAQGQDGAPGPPGQDGAPGAPGAPGQDGATAWVTTIAPVTPDYTFTKSNLHGPTGHTVKEGDIIFYSYYRYRISTVGATTVLGTDRTSIQGSAGPASYVWVKYADSPTEGMSDSPENKAYIGLAFNKSTATESTDYEDYQWSLLPQNVDLTEDFDAIYQTINSLELTLNADIGEIEGMQIGYENRMQNVESASSEAKASLSALTSSVVAVETTLGSQSVKWNFLDSRIIQIGDQGLWIGDDDVTYNSSTGKWQYTNGILIGKADGVNQIVFYNNSVQTAHIIDGTMNIDHGIFVESAVIAGFKFEKVGSTNILSISHVG